MNQVENEIYGLNIDEFSGAVRISRERPLIFPRHPSELTEEERDEIAQAAFLSFKVFIREIFALSFPRGFVHGQYVEEVADFMQCYRNTVRVSPRDHLKSTGLAAYIMWKLFCMGTQSIEGFYFSFKEDIASYLLGKVKNLIKINPWFESCIDLKPRAESILQYTWDKTAIFKITPHGLFTAVRGLHGDLLFIDDPFKDPANRMILTNILKVNENFENVAMDIPDKMKGETHVVGTPQTYNDFFYNKKLLSNFAKMMRPAIENEVEKKALWPEWLTYDELCAIRDRRPKSFGPEYMIKPLISESSYFKAEEIYGLCSTTLQPMRIFDKITPDNPRYRNRRIAGHDIGKKVHPAHFTVWEEVPVLNERGDHLRDHEKNPVYRLIQIHQKWMDGWDYTNGKDWKGKDPEEVYDTAKPTQIEYIRIAQKNLDIDEIYFDNTNQVWESFIEQGLLPKPTYKPIVFSAKTKNQFASCFGQEVKAGRIELINDPRQARQILAVTNDLDAAESEEGHGDSFWSNGMALWGFRDKQRPKTFRRKPVGF